MKESANQKLKKWLDNMRDLTEDEEKACSKALENMSEEVEGLIHMRVASKCICEKEVFPTPMFKDLGECMYCHRFYKLEDDRWVIVDREGFSILYRERLIEKQWR